MFHFSLWPFNYPNSRRKVNAVMLFADIVLSCCSVYGDVMLFSNVVQQRCSGQVSGDILARHLNCFGTSDLILCLDNFVDCRFKPNVLPG